MAVPDCFEHPHDFVRRLDVVIRAIDDVIVRLRELHANRRTSELVHHSATICTLSVLPAPRKVNTQVTPMQSFKRRTYACAAEFNRSSFPMRLMLVGRKALHLLPTDES